MRELVSQSDISRATFFKRLSGGLAILLALAMSISLISRVYSVPQRVQVRPYDGVTLYRGLFFASGPVAGKISTLGKVSRYFPPEYKSLENPIIKYIQEKDPKFFDRFAQEIQSGDRVRVAAEIRSTNKLQREALLAVTKNSTTPFALKARRLVNPTEKEPEAENDANVAIEVLVFVLVFVVAFWAAPPDELKGLTFERYVDEIVRAVPRMPAVREARP